MKLRMLDICSYVSPSHFLLSTLYPPLLSESDGWLDRRADYGVQLERSVEGTRPHDTAFISRHCDSARSRRTALLVFMPSGRSRPFSGTCPASHDHANCRCTKCRRSIQNQPILSKFENRRYRYISMHSVAILLKPLKQYFHRIMDPISS